MYTARKRKWVKYGREYKKEWVKDDSLTECIIVLVEMGK